MNKYKRDRAKVRKHQDKYCTVSPWVKQAEFKLDRYNHLMELMRTCLAGCTLILQIVILLKLFGAI